MNGYGGRILHIDLGKQNFSVQNFDEAVRPEISGRERICGQNPVRSIKTGNRRLLAGEYGGLRGRARHRFSPALHQPRITPPPNPR